MCTSVVVVPSGVSFMDRGNVAHCPKTGAKFKRAACGSPGASSSTAAISPEAFSAIRRDDVEFRIGAAMGIDDFVRCRERNSPSCKAMAAVCVSSFLTGPNCTVGRDVALHGPEGSVSPRGPACRSCGASRVGCRRLSWPPRKAANG